jgi:hypothetical protein
MVEQHEPDHETGGTTTTSIDSNGESGSVVPSTAGIIMNAQQQQSTSKDDREIDNIALGKLLRDCAEVVERGEFDSILYEALQNFRLYYKQKYPKTVKRSKSKDDGKKKSAVAELEESAAAEVLSSQQKYPKTVKRTKSKDDGKKKSKKKSAVAELEESAAAEVLSSQVVQDQVVPTEATEVSTTLEIVEPDIVVEETVETVVENTPASVHVADTVKSATETIDIPAAVEPEIVAPTVVDVPEPTTLEVPVPTTSPAEVPVVIPAAPSVVIAPPVQPVVIESAANLARPVVAVSAPPKPATTKPNSNNTTATKFHMGTAVFGNFKLPILQTVKQATFGATSKKNATRARDDLEAFQNKLSVHAESSARRPALQSALYNHSSSRSVNGSISRTFTEISLDSTGVGETRSLAGGGGARAVDDSFSHGIVATAEDVEFAGEKSNLVDENATSEFRTTTTDLSQQHGQTLPSTASIAVGQQPQQTQTYRSSPVDDINPSGSGDGSSVNSSSQRNIDSGAAAGLGRLVGSQNTQSSAHSTRTASVTPPATTMSVTKPSFQRPTSAASALIANGWIEQYRRSKMRFVWKEVLASLVEGRKPGEETTLWIQREVVHPTTGRKELEALHQIPIKFVEDVNVKHTTDHQFFIKLFNSSEEYVFRCSEAPMDCVRWVQELKAVKNGGRSKIVEEEKKGPDVPPPPAPPQQILQQRPHQQMDGISPEIRGMGVRDLRAMCHGAGINTAGMERTDLERAAEEVRRRGTYFDQRGAAANASARPHSAGYPPQYLSASVAGAAAAAAASGQPHFAQPPPPQQHQPQGPPSAPTSGSSSHHEYALSHAAAANPPTHQLQQQENRLSVKELRSICHGAGINTVGMERVELERAAEEVRSRGTYFDPPPGMHAPSEEEARARQDEYRRHLEDVRAQQEDLRRQEDIRRRQEQDAERQKQEEEYRVRAEEETRRIMAEEEQRRREAEERHRRLAEDEVRRRAAIAEEEARRRAAVEEEARRRAAVEEEARRRAAEAEHRQRLAAEEQLRRQQEAQEQYRQQQAAWQKQQQEEEHRRRVAEHHNAEQRRLHEEALRKQQQWAASSNPSQPQKQTQPPQRQQQQWNQQNENRAYSQPHHPPSWQQQQQQQQQTSNNRPPPQQDHRQEHPSAASQKYAKMANQAEDGGQAAITRIKHEILIQWALQPPQLQMLRPIDMLITTIHRVFPPALGVSGHDYFTKWTPITIAEIVVGASRVPDDGNLKKAVRKLRFFLHPDKLPRDLNEEQKFMTKMLWDVTSDAWDEFQKNREDLDWVTS